MQDVGAALRAQDQAARLALQQCCHAFGDGLFERLPSLWLALQGPLTAAPLEAHALHTFMMIVAQQIKYPADRRYHRINTACNGLAFGIDEDEVGQTRGGLQVLGDNGHVE